MEKNYDLSGGRGDYSMFPLRQWVTWMWSSRFPCPEGVLSFHCQCHRRYTQSSESTGEVATHDQHGQAWDGVQALWIPSSHWLDEHEFEQALGVGDRQGGLACCSPWDHKKSHNLATELNSQKWPTVLYGIILSFLCIRMSLHLKETLWLGRVCPPLPRAASIKRQERVQLGAGLWYAN